MMVLITYDVSFKDPEGGKRLRHIAKHCQDYGIRVQHSTFECELTPAQLVELKAKLFAAYDSTKDSIRFYMLGTNWIKRVEHYGAKPAIAIFKDPLIVD